MQHERAGYGEEKLNVRAVGSLHDGDSRGESCNPTMQTTPMICSTPPLLLIPAGVHRMMVLYPRGESPGFIGSTGPRCATGSLHTSNAIFPQ